MDFLFSILHLVVGFFTFILVLRTWFQFCRVDPYMPLSQTLLRLTEPVVSPVNKVIPNIKNINIAALVIAIALITLEFLLVNFPVQIAVLIGVLSVLKAFGQILFFTTLIRALMSWVTQGNHPLDYLISQITEPVLGLIRRFLPKTGMLDFSVMVLAFILILLDRGFFSVFGTLWNRI